MTMQYLIFDVGDGNDPLVAAIPFDDAGRIAVQERVDLTLDIIRNETDGIESISFADECLLYENDDAFQEWLRLDPQRHEAWLDDSRCSVLGEPEGLTEVRTNYGNLNVSRFGHFWWSMSTKHGGTIVHTESLNLESEHTRKWLGYPDG